MLMKQVFTNWTTYSCLSKKLLNIPPIPLLFPRESKEACKITGYDMPAESKVTVNIWGIGREPINWTEPERFYPERFLDNSMDYKGIDFKFIPFGAGILFGMATVVLPLAQLLCFLDWIPPNGLRSAAVVPKTYELAERVCYPKNLTFSAAVVTICTVIL
ncbi:hypothetical protein Peur_000932 [Populus x canadensis]